ncbi:hypothetical protein ACRALDRAFT_2069014, partial [Sodiomyces alcalophilus JCM 7366]|uniref:uncharacterized protein n=1 Tax=Sodiomyces alcalophilus JCM 7366 TaxID=591952 RepID=UPI0039B552EC
TQPATPTGPYTTYASRITLSGDVYEPSGSVISDGSTTTTTRVPISRHEDYTVITGRETSTTFSGNFSITPTTTSTTEQPTNTRPCNNYVEFCNRKWSNITYIGCHNSPFVRPGNAAANQELDVTAQLNDGVRFLQAQIQFAENDTEPHFCHTSCDVLDAGPITQWLTTVKEWVQAHPFDVVTILLGNGNHSDPSLYAPYIESTGITQYAYEPPYLPMTLDDWPTLAELIIRGKRVIMFMDYMADQRRYPWLLDQFSQMWETPFNPQDRNFPCTVQRPPGLGPDAARDRLYLLNHNLNAEYNLFGSSILVPAVSLLNETNNVTGHGSLGSSTHGCVADWGRPPNILNVDYYNYGGYPGSVFEVAAMFNNVTYDRECCGKDASA